MMQLITYKEARETVFPECVEDAECIDKRRTCQEQPEAEELGLCCVF